MGLGPAQPIDPAQSILLKLPRVALTACWILLAHQFDGDVTGGELVGRFAGREAKGKGLRGVGGDLNPLEQGAARPTGASPHSLGCGGVVKGKGARDREGKEERKGGEREEKEKIIKEKERKRRKRRKKRKEKGNNKREKEEEKKEKEKDEKEEKKKEERKKRKNENKEEKEKKDKKERTNKEKRTKDKEKNKKGRKGRERRGARDPQAGAAAQRPAASLFPPFPPCPVSPSLAGRDTARGGFLLGDGAQEAAPLHHRRPRDTRADLQHLPSDG